MAVTACLPDEGQAYMTSLEALWSFSEVPSLASAPGPSMPLVEVSDTSGKARAKAAQGAALGLFLNIFL